MSGQGVLGSNTGKRSEEPHGTCLDSKTRRAMPNNPHIICRDAPRSSSGAQEGIE